MEISNIERWVEKGYLIGGHIYTKKRITIKYRKADKHRRDVAPGTKASIKGFIDDQFLVCEFQATDHKGKDITVEWKVREDNCTLDSPDEEMPAGKSSGLSVQKVYPWLFTEGQGDDNEVSVADSSWPQALFETEASQDNM